MKYHGACGTPVHSLRLDERRAQSETMYSRTLGERIYVAMSSELGLEHRPTLHGFASAGVHTLVAESLPLRYTGPRPGIIVVDTALRGMDEATAALLFDGIVLHEVAHLASIAITADVCAHFHGREHRAEALAPAISKPLLWIHHDCRFIRALCHLAHRVRSRGHWASLPLAFSHEAYGLSPAEAYATALGDECSATSWLPLKDALSRPSPAEFQKLWDADVLRSLKSCPVLRSCFDAEDSGKVGRTEGGKRQRKADCLGGAGRKHC